MTRIETLGFTSARLDALAQCNTSHGHHPVGTVEWTAIYWLEENGYVESDGRSRSKRRYRTTVKGDAELQARDAPGRKSE
jgi:hypothetical protein